MAASLAVIEARYRRGNEARRAGQFAVAESELRSALADAPTHRDAAYSLAFMLREQGRTNAAAEVVAAWWHHAQPDADDSLRAIGFLIESFAFESALDIAEHSLRRWPDDARIASRAGEVALGLGRFDQAQTYLRDAVARDANQSAAWLRLSHCRKFTDANDADIAGFRTALDSERSTAVTRICAGFALGKALDDIGDIENTARILRNANERARATVAWDAARWSNFAKRRLDESIAMPASSSEFTPIFVIGMPRTGTTLVSTMLAQLDGVRDRGELNWVSAVYAQLFDLQRLDDPEALRACADLIQAHMRRDDAPAKWYVDKNPLNVAYVDFIAAMFPRARFVHCRRDARDTALSIWSQHFAHEDLAFAYDFPSIAQVAGDERVFMQRWRERFGERIIDVDYESLVADRDAQSRRLADFIGASQTGPASNAPQTLTTASVWQARQPVYSSSVGRWEKYAPFVPELNSIG